MSSAFEITAAQPSEADALTAIAFAAKRHWGYPEHWIAHWAPQLTITPESVAAHETYAARIDSLIIGFAALAVDDGTLHLKDLWVMPSAMGRGVGRALFQHAQQRAHTLSFDTFEIESDPNAAGFYQRLGAEQIRTHLTQLDGKPRELPVFRCRTSRV